MAKRIDSLEQSIQEIKDDVKQLVVQGAVQNGQLGEHMLRTKQNEEAVAIARQEVKLLEKKINDSVDALRDKLEPLQTQSIQLKFVVKVLAYLLGSGVLTTLISYMLFKS